MKRVMIVDDGNLMRAVLRDIVENMGYEVVGEAVNGKDAVDMYSDLKPDFVTMDITMPDMDGITAVKEIMNIDPQANIIMCSSISQQSLVIDAIRAGAKDFFAKPVSREIMKDVFATVAC